MTRTPSTPSPDVEAAMIAGAEAARLHDPRLAEGLARLAPLLSDAFARYCGAATPVERGKTHYGRRTDLAARFDGDPDAPPGRWATMASPTAPGVAHLWLDDAAVAVLLAKSLRDGAEPDHAPGPRDSSVERRMVARIAEALGCCIRASLDGEGPGNVDLEPRGSRPDDRDLGGFGALTYLSVGGAEARLAVLVPVEATTPRGGVLPSSPRAHLPPALAKARLRLAARVSGRMTTLGAAMAWEPGAFIELGTDPSGPLRVSVGGTPLFEGEVGRDAGPDLACRITRIPQPQDAP